MIKKAIQDTTVELLLSFGMVRKACDWRSLSLTLHRN